MGENGELADFVVSGPVFASNHFEKGAINYFCFSVTSDILLTRISFPESFGEK